MNKGILIVLVAFLLVADFAYAYPITYVIRATNSNDFNTYVTGCDGLSCSNLVGRPYDVYQDSGDNPSGYADKNEYSIFGVSGTDYHAEFHFADGFLPIAYIVSTDDSTSSPSTFDITFNKKSDCSSQVNSISTSTSPVKGEKTKIVVDLASAFTRGAIPSSMMLPGNYKDFFSSRVRVDVTVTNKTDDGTVTTLNGEKEILMGSSDKIEIEWTPQAEGTYALKATTTVTDSACTSQTSKTNEADVTVSSTAPPSPTPTPSSSGGGGGGGGGRRRAATTEVSLPSSTTLTLKESKFDASPGDTVLTRVSIFNGEDSDETFRIRLKETEGFKATLVSVSIPKGITKNVDFIIDVRDASIGKNNVGIIVENGAVLTRNVQVEVDWDIELSARQTVDEKKGLITIDYTVQNKEQYDASGEVVIQDGENETSENVIAKASSVTAGSIEYPIEYSGNHDVKVSFLQDDIEILSEELEFSAEAREGLGTTGLFIAGGSIAGGIVILLLMLALLWMYERKKSEPSKAQKIAVPILDRPVVVKQLVQAEPKTVQTQPEAQKPEYYTSIFAEKQY